MMTAIHNFLLLHADSVELNNKWNYRNVISPFYRLYYIDKGSGILSTSQEEVILEENYLYLIPSFTFFNQQCQQILGQHYIHFIEETADGSSLFTHYRKLFKIAASQQDISLIKQLIKRNPGRDLRQSDNPKVYEKTAVLQSFIHRNRDQSPAVKMETEGIIRLLLSRFMEDHFFQQKDNHKISPVIPESLNHIGTHLQDKLTVEILASRANLSTDYFSRLFLKETGERPLQFIQTKRIERAQFLLLTTSMPLSQIAEETGFEDLPYFSKIFKRITGCTPGAYKQAQLW